MSTTRCVVALAAAAVLAACGPEGGAPADGGLPASEPADGTASGSDDDGASAHESVARPAIDEPGGVERPPADSPDVAEVVAGLNDVGLELLRLDADGNAILSPLSIGVAFAMADVGATGATADALADLFAHPVDDEARWSAFNTLDQALAGLDDADVRMANRLFPDIGFVDRMEPTFDQTLATWFGAGAEVLPLAEPESRDQINAWVAEQTEDLIDELLPEGMPSTDSELVLVNTLYLDVQWARPFRPAPDDGPFSLLDGSQVAAEFMTSELRTQVAAGDGWVAAEVPYLDDDLSMLVVVPDEGRWDDVVGAVDTGLLAVIDDTAEEVQVELTMPGFETTSSLDLGAAFDALGVTDVFGAGGSWDGIAPGIELGSGVHAATIEVDEEGTLAAAATALDFESSGPPPTDVVIRADRPFLHLVRHTPTGTVLFAGLLTDPTA